MWNKLFPNKQAGDDPAEVVPLRPTDASRVKLGWGSSFSTPSLQRQIERQPDYAFWLPRSGEYIVGEPWRRRDDIGSIIEMGAAGAARAALVERLNATFAAEGRRVVVLNFEGWENHRKFYADYGFGALERIVYFEKPNMTYNYAPNSAIAPQISITPMREGELDQLITVDHTAFPWLWWNSREEMADYLRLPDVRVFLARYAGEVRGYFSFTIFERWGHLDRIAVDPSLQGVGLGAAQLARCIEEMKKYRINKITLSTQGTNYQSQKLYTRFAFRQTQESYWLHGMSLVGGGVTTT